MMRKSDNVRRCIFLATRGGMPLSIHTADCRYSSVPIRFPNSASYCDTYSVARFSTASRSVAFCWTRRNAKRIEDMERKYQLLCLLCSGLCFLCSSPPAMAVLLVVSPQNPAGPVYDLPCFLLSKELRYPGTDR